MTRSPVDTEVRAEFTQFLTSKKRGFYPPSVSCCKYLTYADFCCLPRATRKAKTCAILHICCLPRAIRIETISMNSCKKHPLFCTPRTVESARLRTLILLKSLFWKGVKRREKRGSPVAISLHVEVTPTGA